MPPLNGIAVELDVTILVTPNGIDAVLDGIEFGIFAGASDFELKIAGHD